MGAGLFAMLSMAAGCNDKDAKRKLVSFQPGEVEITQYQGESTLFTVRASLRRAPEGAVHAFLDFPDGVIKSILPLTQDGLRYSSTLAVSEALGSGTHKGFIGLRLCRDPDCVEQYPGSPFSLPYSIVNLSHTNLTPLATLAVSDWATHQGNARHTGYVPAAFEAARFSLRWLWKVPGPENEIPMLNNATVGNGVVYLTSHRPLVGEEVRLYAVAEQDKSLLWSKGLGIYQASSAALSSDTVAVMTNDSSNSYLLGFDPADGAARFSRQASSTQLPSPMAPVIADGTLFTAVSAFSTNNISAFDAISGAPVWASDNGTTASYSPAIGGNTLYFYAMGSACQSCFRGLKALSLDTGALLYQIADTDFTGSSNRVTPMLVDANTIVTLSNWYDGDETGPNRLLRFDLVGRDVDWSVAGEFVGFPAFANGVVYVMNAGTGGLEARDLDDGSLLWSWQAGAADRNEEGVAGFYGNVVVTDSHVFFSTSQRVVAVNLVTHREEWAYPHRGSLSLSASGVLYIVRDDGYTDPVSGAFINNGFVAAVNLQ